MFRDIALHWARSLDAGGAGGDAVTSFPEYSALADEWANACAAWCKDHTEAMSQNRRAAATVAGGAARDAAARLERQRRRYDALHAEYDAWTAAEATEATARVAQERDDRAQAAATPVEEPPTAPHTPKPAAAPEEVVPPKSLADDPVIAGTPSTTLSTEALDPCVRSHLHPSCVSLFDQASERFGCGDFRGALTALATIADSGTATMVASMVTNRALCLFRARDHRRCLQALQGMLATGCAREAMTPLGLALATRCAFLVMDLRTARIALAKVARYPQATAEAAAYAATIDHLEHYRDAVTRRNTAEALRHIAAACSATHDVALELLRIDCLVLLRPHEAAEDVASLLEAYPGDAALWAWRGQLLLTDTDALDILPKAQQHLLRALSIDPACGRARHLLRVSRLLSLKLSAGRTAQDSRRWKEGLTEYQSALTGAFTKEERVGDDPGGWAEACAAVQAAALMQSIRVEALCCQLKGGDYAAVAAQCTSILRDQRQRTLRHHIRPAILKSFRAQAFVALGDFPRALLDAREVYAEAPSAESREFIQYIESQMERAQGGASSSGNSSGPRRPSSSSGASNPRRAGQVSAASAERTAMYAILNVQQGATSAEISKAFKVEALKWHPDKWASATSEARLAAEERFKQLNNAYSALVPS